MLWWHERWAVTIAAATAAAMCGCAPPEEIDTTLLDSADQLYSDEHVWDVRIELSLGSFGALEESPRDYVIGDVRIAGELLLDVGVRLKGGFSFRPLGDKSSFKIKFNWQQRDRRWLGLEGITLNAMWQDRSFVHEWASYSVFRAAGVPAPRSGFARVFVNGELYGLYASIESIDDPFLDRNFSDGSGNLYEGSFGVDLRPDDLWEYEQDEGSDLSRSDLAHLIAVAQTPGDEIFFGAEELLDTRAFFAEVASECVTGHWDGYWKSHNYRIYRDPALDRWSLIPWGTDQSFERELDPFAGAGLLTQKCMALPGCAAEYARVATEVIDAVDGLDLPRELDRVAVLLEPYAAADPKVPYPLAKIHRHQAFTRHYLATRAAAVRERLQCMESGVEVDRDGDGHGACFDDCDDGSSLARPGGTEVCDGLDNDCNGFVDDLPQCTCPVQVIDGVPFHFCSTPYTWARAAQHCRDLGAELATIDSAAQNAMVWARAREVFWGFWFIGLNDRQEEGVWRWSDDAAPLHTSWPEGEPDSFGDEDCAVLDPFADGGWSDRRCSERYPFVCRG